MLITQELEPIMHARTTVTIIIIIMFTLNDVFYANKFTGLQCDERERQTGIFNLIIYYLHENNLLQIMVN